MKPKRTHLVNHVTNITGLVVILVFCVLLSITSLRLQQATHIVQISIEQSGTYQQLLFALTREEMILDVYERHPSFAVRNDQLAVATTISKGVQRLQQDANPADETTGEQISIAQTHYLFYSGQFFAAIDARAFTQATTLRLQYIDPLLHETEQKMNQRISLVTSSSIQALADTTEAQYMFLVLGPCMLIISIVLMVFTMYVMRNYRRKMKETRQSEVAYLQRLAFTDPLTGLGNHFAYQERLTLLLKELQRSGAELVLARLNLDEFQHFNDEYGHQRGDDLLVSFAMLLREIKPSGDVFRLAGDDFALILSYTSLPEATVILERLREDVERHLVKMSVSIGMAVTVSDASTSEMMRIQASAALAESKRRGRNRVVAFARMAGDMPIVTFAKTLAARRILSEHKMNVVFQPIWDLNTQRVLAFEALSRPDPLFGLSGPQELFDVIERIGRAHEMDVICVEAILARADELPPGALLFLNLSPQSLVHDLLSEATLLEAVISAGLEPARVVLEITERSIVNMDQLIAKIKRLQLLGFRIALDDAGAGNAGLEMLSRLPVDFVKIDRMVVTNALTDQAVRSVFLGLTTIAREAGIDVVAEGIETPEMLEFVQQARVRCAQGYLLGRPSPTISASSIPQDLSLLQAASV